MNVRRASISGLLPLLAIAACAPAGGERTLTPSLATAADAGAWEFHDTDSWSVEDGSLRLRTPGIPGGPIRKPAGWAILHSDAFGDAVIDAQVRADAPVTRMGRDILIYFGYQSPTRFYYAHLSNETTPPHNGIFLVNDADRLRIDDARGIPKLMDDRWHDVRLERDSETGTIRVYLDDMITPVLQATDTTLRSGRIGFGSFDDPASFRAIEVRSGKR
jgi:hypothetical protein